MQFNNEAARIRDAYVRRDTAGKDALYGWAQPDVLLSAYTRSRTIISQLRRGGVDDLSNLEILDIGCGTGAWLRMLQDWGANPDKMHGLDLMPNRIEVAKFRSPHIDFRVSEGWPLPFEDSSLDMVSTHTVFSSILDPEARFALAAEMMRVLRPGGFALVYDFRIGNPRNPDTTGIGSLEIKRLFPSAKIRSRSVTLAPPIARTVTRISPALAFVFESCCPFLRTHSVHLISKVL